MENVPPISFFFNLCKAHMCSTKLWEKAKQAFTATLNIIFLPGLCHLCSSQGMGSWKQQKDNPIGCKSSSSCFSVVPVPPSLSCEAWRLFLSASTEWSGIKRLRFCYYDFTKWKLPHCYLGLGNKDSFFLSLEIPRFLVEMQGVGGLVGFRTYLKYL